MTRISAQIGLAAEARPTGGQTLLWFVCAAALALLVAPAVLAAAGSPFGEVLRWLASPICHQLPERSFSMFGEPLAVCQRCAGLYLGFVLGAASWPRLPRLAARLAASPRWVLAFMIPLGIDWAVANTAASRFATGLLAAFPVALLALLALANSNRTMGRNMAGG